MSDKKILLGFAAVVLLLTTLSGISSFMLSALCAIMAILVAIAAVAAIKVAAVSAKTAITGDLSTKEGNKKVAAGRIAALGVAIAGIATAALAVFTATSMDTIGIFAIPMITALYLYNYKEREAAVEKQATVKDKNIEETPKSAEAGVKEVSCQLISSALTDVNDNLLYGLGDGIGHYAHSLYNKVQQVFAQIPSRAQA